MTVTIGGLVLVLNQHKEKKHISRTCAVLLTLFEYDSNSLAIILLSSQSSKSVAGLPSSFLCACTHIHRCDVVLVSLSDLLHDLHLSLTAGFDGAFNCDGSLWIIQRQVLETAHRDGTRRGVTH